MEPIQIKNPSYVQLAQERIATKILKLGHTIFGDYVYKTLVNGDSTPIIDVVVPGATYTYGNFNGNCKGVDDLSDYLTEKFHCKCFDAGHIGYDDIYSVHMLCPGINDQDENKVTVNIFDGSPPNKGWISPIFKLNYKKVDGKALIVNDDGNEESCKKTVTDMRNRKFSSWKYMNDEDKWYFNGWRWTDTNSLTYKIKQHFGFEE